jgi:hypothetical protein
MVDRYRFGDALGVEHLADWSIWKRRLIVVPCRFAAERLSSKLSVTNTAFKQITLRGCPAVFGCWRITPRGA